MSTEQDLKMLPSFGKWREEIAPDPTEAEFNGYFASLSPAEILSSDTCLACGGAKRSAEVLCPGCYAHIPPAGRSLLPARINNYITRPVEASAFKDRLRTALAVVKEQREG